jgi:hypothetical protein
MAFITFPTTATATARDDTSVARTGLTRIRFASADRGRTDWFFPAAFALAAVALGAALQVNYGQYHPLALAWLTLAAAACVAGVLRMPRGATSEGRGRRRVESPDLVILAAGVAAQFAMLLSRSPALAELDARVNLLPFRAGLTAAAAFVALAAFGPQAVRRIAVLLLLACHFALGLWLLRATPQPAVDVCVFQRDACEALLQGRNPYAITFLDVSPAGQNFYGPGLSAGGRLLFGYPYPPLSLLLAIPGHLLGDYRYSQLAAMTLAGGLVAFCRPARRATLAAALLLFTPRGFFVLQVGWTEPFVALLLALTVFLASRTPQRLPTWAVAVAFGLLLASKQYLVLALPLVVLLPSMERKRLRFLVVAAIAALLVTLPLAFWDVQAFGHGAVLLQFRQPFRQDALSYLVPLAHAAGVVPSSFVPFALAAGAIGLCLWTCPRTASGFSAGVAMTFLVFFAFNKQAFCNYYHLVIAALCCAVATSTGSLPFRECDGKPTHFPSA